MSDEDITAEEIKIIKFGERALVPLLVAALIGVGASYFSTRDAVAQIETKMTEDDKREVTVIQRQQEASKALEQFRRTITAMDIEIQKIQIRMEYILDDIGAIESQNQKILELMSVKADESKRMIEMMSRMQNTANAKK